MLSAHSRVRSHLINTSSGVPDGNFHGIKKEVASETEWKRWVFWPATLLLLG
jgi:hypothetical protein